MVNQHGTLVSIGDTGVLITGPAGGGKSSFALHLLRRCHYAKIPAILIADDQVLLSQSGGSLVGSVPESLKGKIEIRGYGIGQFEPTKTSAEITFNVSLTQDQAETRMWDNHFAVFEKIEIKKLTLSSRNLEAAGNALFAMLGYPLWV